MPKAENPYQPPASSKKPAAPRADTATGALHLLNGDTLVAEKGSRLPPICLWNGESCSGDHTTRKLTWLPGWAWIFIVSPILFVLVYFLARRRAELSFYFGIAAQRRRRQALLLVGGAVLLGSPLVGLGLRSHMPLLVALASLGAFVALLGAVLQSPTLYVLRIDERNVHIKLRPSAAAAFSRAMAEGGYERT